MGFSAKALHYSAARVGGKESKEMQSVSAGGQLLQGCLERQFRITTSTVKTETVQQA